MRALREWSLLSGRETQTLHCTQCQKNLLKAFGCFWTMVMVSSDGARRTPMAFLGTATEGLITRLFRKRFIRCEMANSAHTSEIAAGQVGGKPRQTIRSVTIRPRPLRWPAGTMRKGASDDGH